MFKLKLLILFVFFIQVVPNIVDLQENEFYEKESLKCVDIMSLITKTDTADKCLARSSLLTKGNGNKCCFFTFKKDPIDYYKKLYGENWKKIVANSRAYDLNISEEEIRNIEMKNIKEENICSLSMKNLDTILYGYSLTSIDGTIKYNCGEGEKIFNKKEFHPKSKDEILDKELIDFSLSISEKDCLKKGNKLSSNDYQMCWCEKIPLSYGSFKEKKCVPYRASTFRMRLRKEMTKLKNEKTKVEYKCTCSNNKNKTIRGRYNSSNGEVKVE